MSMASSRLRTTNEADLPSIASRKWLLASVITDESACSIRNSAHSCFQPWEGSCSLLRTSFRRRRQQFGSYSHDQFEWLAAVHLLLHQSNLSCHSDTKSDLHIPLASQDQLQYGTSSSVVYVSAVARNLTSSAARQSKLGETCIWLMFRPRSRHATIFSGRE
jgi:hypothetical protein